MPKRMRGWATVEDVIIFHDEVLFMLINLLAHNACYQLDGLVGFLTSYPFFPFLHNVWKL